MKASPESFPLLAELLAEQQRLATPVARFSEHHDLATVPAHAGRYRDAIPLTAPRPGEQYAFEVELESCTGCKSCVSACHALNGLDDTESWRDVGLLVGGDHRHPFQQTITTACHHCADPACLNGCPVLAYEKDPVTGIVRHLDDQCIGCQYCVLKCPYDVPKYNARLGIVRKCDMCHGRLEAGEAPACVQSCPTQAIRIVTVGVTATVDGPSVDVSDFLKAAPDPAYTQPTTRYVGRRALPADARAADAAQLRPQPTHWPLALMLTLMPLATTLTGLAALRPLWRVAGIAAALSTSGFATRAALSGWVLGLAGLVCSVAHLGQPLRAWRVFLGWRQSWLSREALAFAAWMAFATAALAALWFGAPAVAVEDLTLAATLAGAAGLVCSGFLYADTRRVGWELHRTLLRLFAGVVSGAAAVAFVFGAAGAAGLAVLAVATGVQIALLARATRAADADDEAPITPQLTVARLLTGPLRSLFGLRVVIGLTTAIVLPSLILSQSGGSARGVVMLAGVLAGELLDRVLFFRAVHAPKMPGMPAQPIRGRGGRR